jgi:hypothetical protein
MFMVHHPLEGKRESEIHCMDVPAMTRLYGTEPLFIFDPADPSNAPVPGYHDNALTFWPLYPQFLRDLFTTAFTDGIRDPQHGRVRESEWRAAMVRLRDAMLYCAQCSAQNFYDGEALRASGGKLRPCWSCHQDLQLPPRMRIGNHTVVMLNHDTRLFPHHTNDQRLYDFSQPVAEVTRHPTDPRIWGLKNLTNDKWVSTTTDGTVRDVAPGRSVTLAVGIKIHFGTAEGDIRL